MICLCKFRHVSRSDSTIKAYFNFHVPHRLSLDPLSANPTKWLNILKQSVGKLPTNCLSVFDHFVKMALKF